MRLFIGVPAAAAEKQLEEVEDALRTASRGAGKFVSPSNFHVTLAFLGETEESRVPVLEKIIEHLSSPAADLLFTRVGNFRGGEVWFAAPEKCPGLDAIHSELAGGLRKEGFRFDGRYTPHLTLARRIPAEGVRIAPICIPLPADRVVLYHSHRTDGNLVYTPLYTKRLSPC